MFCRLLNDVERWQGTVLQSELPQCTVHLLSQILTDIQMDQLLMLHSLFLLCW